LNSQIEATCEHPVVVKPTILKLLARLGSACSKYQDTAMRNVHAQRVQVDEIWQYAYAKAKNVPEKNAARSALATCGLGLRWMPTPS
jgi:hypothetical protein